MADGWISQEEIAVAQIVGGDESCWDDTHNWCRGITSNGNYGPAMTVGLAESVADIAVPWEAI